MGVIAMITTAVIVDLTMPITKIDIMIAAVVANRPSPADEAARLEQAQAVRKCLAQLAEADREVLMLRVFDGLSNAEVAMMLEQKPATTKKRFARALLKIKQLLRDSGIEESRS